MGDKNWDVNLRNGTINFGITNEVGSETVFTYGQFIEQLNFGGEMVEGDVCSNDIVLKTDTAAIYLAEYDDQGRLITADSPVQYDGFREDLPYGQIAVSPNDEIHASLRFTGDIQLNNGRILNESMGKDIVYKIDKCMVVDWHVQLAGAVNQTVNTKVDSHCNVYVVGAYTEALYVNGNKALTTSMCSNMFLLKLDDRGRLIWAIDADDHLAMGPCNDCHSTSHRGCNRCPPRHRFEDNHVDSKTVTVTLNGNNPVVVGSYTNYVTFDNQSLVNPTSRANAYVAEFDACDGSFYSLMGPKHCPIHPNDSMAACIDSSNDFMLGESLDVDDQDNVYFTGPIRGRFQFDQLLIPERDEDLLEILDQNIYVTKVTRENVLGDFEWSRLVRSTVPPASSFYPNVDVLPDGRVYLAGQATGEVVFEGPTDADGIDILDFPSRLYLFASSLNTDGVWMWSAPEAATVNNAAEHISSNNAAAHIAGTFIVNQSQTDPFVAQLEAV